MSAYEALAASYDRLTEDINYADMLAFLEEILHINGKTPKTVLDLACGTGSMSVLLAQKGYQVTGADLSEDMLCAAYEKAQCLEKNRPFFICQPMQALSLAQQVDWVVCCLDSLNYVTDPAACRKTMECVYNALTPGGIFTFDINSAAKLRGLDGQIFLDEDDDVYCVWRADFEEAENICYYGMDIFQREGDIWHRGFEEHAEYAYEVQTLQNFLREVGFVKVQVYGEGRLQEPQENEQRIYFAAIKG